MTGKKVDDTLAKPAAVHLQLRLLTVDGKPLKCSFFLEWGEEGSADETPSSGTLDANGRLAVDVNPAIREGTLYLLDELDEHYKIRAWAVMKVRLTGTTTDHVHRLNNLGFSSAASVFDAVMRFQQVNQLWSGLDQRASGNYDAATEQRLLEVHDKMDSKFFK